MRHERMSSRCQYRAARTVPSRWSRSRARRADRDCDGVSSGGSLSVAACLMPLSRMPLLAQLARYDWFTRVGESATRQFLNGLLEEPSLNQAITALVARRSGRDSYNVVQWRPEQVQADGGRTDLEGLDPEGRPRIIVEVKFGARLSSGQMFSYLRSQTIRLGEEGSVLVALVPEYRRGECERELAVARGEVGAARDRTVTLSWDEWLDAWDAADVADDVRCDLAQLRGLCAALSGLAIPPFAREPGADWAQREADLLGLLQLVTRRLTPQGARLPAQGLDEFSWYARPTLCRSCQTVRRCSVCRPGWSMGCRRRRRLVAEIPQGHPGLPRDRATGAHLATRRAGARLRGSCLATREDPGWTSWATAGRGGCEFNPGDPSSPGS